MWNTQSGASSHVVAFLGHSYNWDHTAESCPIIPDEYFYHLNFKRFGDGWWEPMLLSYQTLFFLPQFQLQSLQILCSSVGAEQDRCCDLPALVRQGALLCSLTGAWGGWDKSVALQMILIDLRGKAVFFSLGNNISVFLAEVNKTMFASRRMKTSSPGAGHIFPVTTSSRSPASPGLCCHLSPKAEHPPHFLSLLRTENCCVGWINM